MKWLTSFCKAIVMRFVFLKSKKKDIAPVPEKDFCAETKRSNFKVEKIEKQHSAFQFEEKGQKEYSEVAAGYRTGDSVEDSKTSGDEEISCDSVQNAADHVKDFAQDTNGGEEQGENSEAADSCEEGNSVEAPKLNSNEEADRHSGKTIKRDSDLSKLESVYDCIQNSSLERKSEETDSSSTYTYINFGGELAIRVPSTLFLKKIHENTFVLCPTEESDKESFKESVYIRIEQNMPLILPYDGNEGEWKALAARTAELILFPFFTSQGSSSTYTANGFVATIWESDSAKDKLSSFAMVIITPSQVYVLSGVKNFELKGKRLVDCFTVEHPVTEMGDFKNAKNGSEQTSTQSF